LRPEKQNIPRWHHYSETSISANRRARLAGRTGAPVVRRERPKFAECEEANQFSLADMRMRQPISSGLGWLANGLVFHPIGRAIASSSSSSSYSSSFLISVSLVSVLPFSSV